MKTSKTNLWNVRNSFPGAVRIRWLERICGTLIWLPPLYWYFELRLTTRKFICPQNLLLLFHLRRRPQWHAKPLSHRSYITSLKIGPIIKTNKLLNMKISPNTIYPPPHPAPPTLKLETNGIFKQTIAWCFPPFALKPISHGRTKSTAKIFIFIE